MAKSKFNIEKFPTSKYGVRMLKRVSPIYNDSYVMKWFMQVMGIEIDELWGMVHELRDQCFTSTTTWAIDYWEDMYSLDHPKDLSIEERRARLKIRQIPCGPLNPTKFAQMLDDRFGLKVRMDETVGFGRVSVRTSVDNQPLHKLNDILDWLVESKPSHLTFDFVFTVRTDSTQYVGANIMQDKEFCIIPKTIEDSNLHDVEFIGGALSQNRKVVIIPSVITDVSIDVKNYVHGATAKTNDVSIFPTFVHNTNIKSGINVGAVVSSSGTKTNILPMITKHKQLFKVSLKSNSSSAVEKYKKIDILPSDTMLIMSAENKKIIIDPAKETVVMQGNNITKTMRFKEE